MYDDNNIFGDYNSDAGEEPDMDELRLRIAERRRRADQLAKDRAHAKLIMSVAAILIVVAIAALLSKLFSEKNGEDTNAYQIIENSSVTDSETDNADAADNSGNFLNYALTDEETDDYSYTSDSELYYLLSDTPYYIMAGDLGVYASGTTSGFYTGTVSDAYSNCIVIDINGGTAFVYSYDAIKISDSKVLGLSVISQYTSIGGGSSGCGAACLSIMMQSAGYDNYDYEPLLDYAENNGYADQGSLHTSSGGMTISSLASLAYDYAGITLTNVYSDAEDVQQTLKSLIDDGKQALVLVAYDSDSGIISSGASNGHFIVVTGYYTTNGSTQFVYGDTLTSESAISLKKVDGELLASSISSYFDEPNTIAYIED